MTGETEKRVWQMAARAAVSPSKGKNQMGVMLVSILCLPTSTRHTSARR